MTPTVTHHNNGMKQILSDNITMREVITKLKSKDKVNETSSLGTNNNNTQANKSLFASSSSTNN